MQTKGFGLITVCQLNCENTADPWETLIWIFTPGFLRVVSARGACFWWQNHRKIRDRTSSQQHYHNHAEEVREAKPRIIHFILNPMCSIYFSWVGAAVLPVCCYIACYGETLRSSKSRQVYRSARDETKPLWSAVLHTSLKIVGGAQVCFGFLFAFVSSSLQHHLKSTS